MSIDDLQHNVITAIAKAAANEGAALGTGDTIDELPDVVVALAAATCPWTFASKYKSANRALLEHWRRRVGAPQYKKALWMGIDTALTKLASSVADKVGHVGPLVSWARQDYHE